MASAAEKEREAMKKVKNHHRASGSGGERVQGRPWEERGGEVKALAGCSSEGERGGRGGKAAGSAGARGGEGGEEIEVPVQLESNWKLTGGRKRDADHPTHASARGFR
eukprot:512550-Hanusia_phi.AAC.5